MGLSANCAVESGILHENTKSLLLGLCDVLCFDGYAGDAIRPSLLLEILSEASSRYSREGARSSASGAEARLRGALTAGMNPRPSTAGTRHSKRLAGVRGAGGTTVWLPMDGLANGRAQTGVFVSLKAGGKRNWAPSSAAANCDDGCTLIILGRRG